MLWTWILYIDSDYFGSLRIGCRKVDEGRKEGRKERKKDRKKERKKRRKRKREKERGKACWFAGFRCETCGATQAP